MQKPISPWIDEAELWSPDGLHCAIFSEGMEVAMGAPTMGRLKVISKDKVRMISNGAAASMVWSSDSRYLAYSEWNRNKKQSLNVYRIFEERIDRIPDEFDVLELRDFREGKVVGVDSPIYRPKTFALEYNTQAEKGGLGNRGKRDF
jgi:hypothetical protein